MFKKKKKKILKIFLLVVLLGGFGSIFVRGFVYHHSTKNNILQDNVSNEVQKQDLIDEDIISSIIESEDKEENKQEVQEQNLESAIIQKEIDNQKVVNTSSHNDNIKTDTNTNTNTNEKTIVNNNVEEKQENNEEKSNNIQEQNNKIEEEQVPPIDEEYLSILNQVDYKADEYSKCSSDSIEVALTDVVNIRNTACKQFAYNGSIVGYKIQIFYRDGTWKYYQK